MRILSIDVGTKNLGLVIVDVKEHWDDFGVKLWTVESFEPAKNVAHNAGLFLAWFDSHTKMQALMSSVDHVVLEQQVAVSKMMQAFAAAIYMFFLCRFPAIPRTMCHASKKMKLCKKLNFYPHKYGKSRASDCNKAAAIDACLYLLEPRPKALAYFRSFKQKKDDLADALLQALAYHLYVLYPEKAKKRKRTHEAFITPADRLKIKARQKKEAAASAASATSAPSTASANNGDAGDAGDAGDDAGDDADDADDAGDGDDEPLRTKQKI